MSRITLAVAVLAIASTGVAVAQSDGPRRKPLTPDQVSVLLA